MEAPRLFDANGGGSHTKSAVLSPKDFARLSAFIERQCGIRMPLAKKTLLESRLRARVLELGMAGFSEYCDHVLGGHSAEELVHMVDKVTTNKTNFFREAQHFEVLMRRALPELAQQHGVGVQRELRVWSAGCSTGEEPYTLAMVLSEVDARGPKLRFQVLATDLSTRVLQHAQAALYQEAQVQPIPLPLRRKYLLRSVADANVVRVVPRLRALVHFRRLNLLDRDYGVRPPVDVIFCRNVFIYFERKIQQEILCRFGQSMSPGGFLFLGHSETINGLDVPFEQVAPTVYRRRGSL